MTQGNMPPVTDAPTTLDRLVGEIGRFESIVAQWDHNQQVVVTELKKSIEALHKEALTRLIRRLKQEKATAALRNAVEDEIVYGLLRYHELIKPPQPPLEKRIQQALDEVRPGLKSHNGDVELVAIELPDTVKVRLVGTCSNCPASTLTMKQGVEQTIKNYCPEITQVISINTPSTHQKLSSPLLVGEGLGERLNEPDYINSPFSSEQETGWIALTTREEIPDGGILGIEIDHLKLILYRNGDHILGYRNSCTHLGMPLDTGTVQEGILTCPFHDFQYRLDTGECLSVPQLYLEPYPIKSSGDRILVKIL
ncbi:Rieske (2Fe-2S) domain protein [Gloeothece citriformis PCC 7424]|uniref:Rieske (2Fe-2S) domain protein n=1 Tax=Gloeothece citriformis (strain PCC 7424) TaxID=65393 RepID=B7KCE0_GLOC7|nr:NifU family protein [Gloeothece citriformis]ACK70245.1 Rieske (2Fe-2S) domain protein [Gloeothece citriformis PCC 7424]